MARIVALEGVWGPALADLGPDAVSLETSDPEDVGDPQLVEAVVVRNRARVDDAFLARFPALRLVARAGAGLDNIDLPAADRRGIVVMAPLGANAESVAEHALALALAVAKRIPARDAATRTGAWDRAPSRELRGSTWGILGAGATGRATGRLARAVGMEVIAHDPWADAAALAAEGIETCPFLDLAERSDVVSVHLPATDATAGLIGADFLARLGPDGILVSVGRGEVVDEVALADALEAGRLAGAGLDVRAVEPPVRGRLETLERVVLTPHIAGITRESQQRILAAIRDDIRTVLGGGRAAFPVGAVHTATAR